MISTDTKRSCWSHIKLAIIFVMFLSAHVASLDKNVSWKKLEEKSTHKLLSQRNNNDNKITIKELTNQPLERTLSAPHVTKTDNEMHVLNTINGTSLATEAGYKTTQLHLLYGNNCLNVSKICKFM